MGNVTLPTPVALAGAALCVLGGYLLGVVAGPDAPERATATVESFDPDRNELCLTGEALQDQPGVEEEGRLCGIWRRTQASQTTPEAGDTFRFVSMEVDGSSRTEAEDSPPVTVIYGNVAR